MRRLRVSVAARFRPLHRRCGDWHAEKAPWVVRLAFTVLLWGYYLYSGVSYQWHPSGTGANIGLGLMMLISPIFITAACDSVYLGQRRKTH
jgi:hypothetical protein